METLEIYDKNLYKESASSIYTAFTLDKYNHIVKELNRKRYENIIGSIIVSLFAGFIFMYNPILSHPLAFFKIVWLLCLPYLIMFAIGRYKIPKQLHIDKEYILRNKEKLEKEKIIFQIVTRGFNENAVRDSVLSVDYWVKKIKEKYLIEINYEIWIITEEDSYKKFIDLEKNINNLKVYFVPEIYKTKKNAKYKARALEFANEIRRNKRLDKPNVWVYHQDEETRIGEDTVFGILEFIIRHSKDFINYGSGIITYPINYCNSITSDNEFARTGDDFRILESLTRGDSLFGYHGSHFLCRSDIESKIGFNENTLAEDYVFSIKVEKKDVLKGFAYEEPPQSIKDFLKQRRRWLIGMWRSLFIRDIRLKYKLAGIYAILTWYSALPSIIVLFQNLFYNAGDIFPFFGFISGFIWFNIFAVIKTGYEINKKYVKKFSLISRIRNVAIGLLIEAIAPWYTLFSKRPMTFEIVRKS